MIARGILQNLLVTPAKNTVREADPAPDTIVPDGKPISARLYDELAMQRRDVLAAALVADRRSRSTMAYSA